MSDTTTTEILPAYLVCPCNGEVPFLTDSLKEVMNVLNIEEYYVIHLPTMRFLDVEGNLDDDVLEDNVEVQNDPS